MKAFIVLCLLTVVSSKPHVSFPGQDLINKGHRMIQHPNRDLIQTAHTGSSRIVNGENADINDHPHQASIRYQYWSNHICGASLIHESGWFVTAAHCVDETSPQMYGIRVGSSEISSGMDYTVQKIIKHSGYNGAASGIPNDIALIQVNGPVDTSPRGVDKIELATGSYTGTYCTITGWGATSGGGPIPSTLQKAILPVISNTECAQRMSNVGGATILSSHVCVYDSYRSACNGDSGGPLVCDGKLVGATSWGVNGCPGTYPSVYTRISSFKSWIESQTGLSF